MPKDLEWSLLASILDKLCDEYNKYLYLAERQKRALVMHQLDEIRNITSEMEEIAENVLNLDSRRADHMESLAIQYGSDHLTLKELISYLQDDERVLLSKKSQRLRELVQDAKKINRVNQVLIENGSLLIRTTIEAISILSSKRVVRERAYKTYGASGSLNTKREMPNLINREG